MIRRCAFSPELILEAAAQPQGVARRLPKRLVVIPSLAEAGTGLVLNERHPAPPPNSTRSVIMAAVGQPRIAVSDNVTLTFEPDDPAGPTQAVIPRRLGHVTLVEEIGKGGMGVVWRGHDELLRREVAVKLFRDQRLASDPVLRQQFIEGSRAAAGVKHPNVVSVYHADQLERLIYVVMELVDGHTLRDVLSKFGSVEPALAALIIARILDALTAIHDAQVIHRDLKPSNVLFDRKGDLLVSDFGLSYQRNFTQPGEEAVLGTPPYMAPELFDGDASFQSDVYAVGITYYELLCGGRPFTADTVADYHLQHRERLLPDRPLVELGVGDDVQELILRSTNKRKIFRYKTAAHMLKAVTDAYPGLLRDQALDRRLRDLMLGVNSAHPRQPSDPGSPDTPQATYFDLLSRRADAKRRRKDGAADGAGETSD